MMKNLANFFFTLAVFGYSAAIHAANPGEGRWVADEIFRASNSTGSTGLLVMDSAYTIRDGEMSFNIGLASESAGGVTYRQAPVSITYGISDRTEFGLAGNYIDASTGTAGLAGGEIKLKWRVRNQTEYLPAVSIGVGLMFPSGPAALNEVTNWGAKLKLMAASEASLTDTMFIGIYMDVGAVNVDGGDNYVTTDVGLLVPISDNRKLQGIVEFNSVSLRANPYLGTTDYTGVTAGLRYASESFKLSLGAQLRANNDKKIMANIGWEF